VEEWELLYIITRSRYDDHVSTTIREITSHTHNQLQISNMLTSLQFSTDTKLYVVNIGDSRGVALEGGKVIPLSFDHNPIRESERERVLAAGGEVRRSNGTFRVYPGGIAVARALGDYPIKIHPNVLSAEPEITVKQITPALKYMVLASDGIYDVLSNGDVVNIAAKASHASEGAHMICTRAYDRFSNDNLTALVVRFN
jgi:serine/threonine protein phosphatase PrpC